ncbi:MAG: 3-deoxy-manno-octulosonate cytidylyltransferase [Candidatus Melainabacteria bacterium]|nr:3-deoxy-manno-octulosonate cytidylyltransferase [Candidatus Melainabacteria bacterium]
MTGKKKVAVVIPARYASTRFPGKPLVKIAGTTMIERVYRQAKACRLVDEVLVATDDNRIKEAVEAFGGNLIMTRDDHPTGTDRLAEVAKSRPDLDIIVNIQGDEPLIDPSMVDQVIAPVLEQDVEMSTLAYPLTDDKDIENPMIVKAVVGVNKFALYFSRLPVPFDRDRSSRQASLAPPARHLGHAGLYVYKRETLLKIAALPETPLESMEKLEQLRALDNGVKIYVVVVENGVRTPAVDVPEDVQIVESFLAALSSKAVSTK